MSGSFQGFSQRASLGPDPGPRHSAVVGSPLTPLPSSQAPRSVQGPRSPVFDPPSRSISRASNPFQAILQPAPPAPSDPALAEAISLLATTLRNPTNYKSESGNERNNVRDPDPFDGSEPTKLRPFFAHLELVFRARPRTFPNDEKKVTYAISYLKGTALQWFEPYLLETHTLNPPEFLSDYESFQEELRRNFGPYDATGTAENDLENLRMSDSQKITKYITRFTQLATQVPWDENALRYQFYKGLPSRLKDRISEVGKPGNLLALRDLSQSLDHRYWERKSEQTREAGSQKSAPKTSTSDNKDQKTSSYGQKSTSNHSVSNSGSSFKPTTQQTTNKPASKPTPKPYADKLGKDGKLTQEERQRRFTNNLCLFCGGSGHTASDCSKKSSSAAKARAAQVFTPKTPEAGAEPKK